MDEQTDDFSLEENEYVRIVGIKADNENIVLTKYFRHKQEIYDFINKYKYNYNIFIGLATTKGMSGDAKSMYKRKVLMLDFDRKDYPGYENVADFSTHIKIRMKILFNHMIVDTGHGYHYYIATNRYKDNQRMTNVNRQLCEILGADMKAVLPTQIVRIPTSINLKDKDNTKNVSVVVNNLESCPEKFKPYHLQKIEGMIDNHNRNTELEEQIERLPSKEYTKISSYYCIESMLSHGVKQGERNFALGRITNYLRDIKGYTEYNALQAVKEWNLRCDPPKNQDIIEQDFKAYWNGKYKLLGCNVPNERDQQTIYRFCDKSMCSAIFDTTREDIAAEEELYFDNNILKNTYLRTLSGFHYMILSVMDFYKRPMKRSELVFALTGRKLKKCCISDNTLRKVLNELSERNLIKYDDYFKKYSLCSIPNYGMGYTKYYYTATKNLVNKIISPTEYLVYLCLVRNLQDNTKVTYENIADNLRMDEKNVGRAIQGLYTAGIITIDKGYNERGHIYNVYKIVA